MMFIRQIALLEIKSAMNEEEIKAVVDRSIHRLKVKNVNGHIIQRFVLAMGASLHQAKADTVTEKVKGNINLAIDLFKGLQKT